MFVNLLHILSIHVHTSLTKINEIVKYSIFNITRNTLGKNNNKEESVRQILGHIFKQKLIKSQTQKHDAPEKQATFVVYRIKGIQSCDAMFRNKVIDSKCLDDWLPL